MSADLRMIENACRAWVVDAVAPDVPANRVVFEDQDGPRPPRPYASILIDALQQVGREDARRVDGTGKRTVTLTEAFTATVNVFGPNARGLADRVATALSLHATLERLRTSGIVSYGHLEVQDLTRLLDETAWEARAAFSARFAVATEATEDVGVIERVVQRAVYERPDGGVASDRTTLTP